jgi:serine/threonine-protein kinase
LERIVSERGLAIPERTIHAMASDDETVPGSPPTELLHELDIPLEALSPTERYASSARLGVGGMGEVRVAHDRHIGRDVAVKAMLPAHRERVDLRARFVREARVQGQLEHPAIVPVYDLQEDDAKHAFFTMKRVHGETLEEIVDALRAGNAHVVRTFSLHRLLAAFARVCLAIDYAHSRGVIHRDLKPANVMLGNFGEVYVLDWGCAKIDEGPSSRRSSSGVGRSPRLTEVGDTIGTPAYMAPEQIEGAHVDARADVYALGGILFEILTLEPLAKGQETAAILAEVLRGVDAHASVRAPHRGVPPELEALCLRATVRNPADRIGSAREVADAVERYLSGDRDVELRRTIAKEQLERARRAARDARAEEGIEARCAALREVGRAVALAPDDPRAMGLLVDVLGLPLGAVPAEVSASVEAAAATSQRQALPRAAVATAFVGVALAPALLALDGRATPIASLASGGWLLCSLVAWLAFRFDDDYRQRPPYLALFMAIATCLSSLLYGPLVLTPAIAIGVAAAYTTSISKRYRPFLVAVMAGAFVAPALLGFLDLHPVRGVFNGDSVTFLLRMHAPASATYLLATAMHLAVLAFSVRFVGLYRDALTESESKNQLFTWQLRQLVPSLDHAPRSNPELDARS